MNRPERSWLPCTSSSFWLPGRPASFCVLIFKQFLLKLCKLLVIDISGIRFCIAFPFLRRLVCLARSGGILLSLPLCTGLGLRVFCSEIIEERASVLPLLQYEGLQSRMILLSLSLIFCLLFAFAFAFDFTLTRALFTTPVKLVPDAKFSGQLLGFLGLLVGRLFADEL